MPRKSRAKPPSPFLSFNSSPEVIRLVVLMYVRFPLSLRNVEDLLFERGIGRRIDIESQPQIWAIGADGGHQRGQRVRIDAPVERDRKHVNELSPYAALRGCAVLIQFPRHVDLWEDFEHSALSRDNAAKAGTPRNRMESSSDVFGNLALAWPELERAASS